MAKQTPPPRRLYWDACVFLALINENEDRIPTIRAILDDADVGNVEIFTSYLTITEVAYAESEKKSVLLDEKIQERIGKLWLPPSPIKLVEINPFVILGAKDLIREAIAGGFPLKPADAIHLATATRMAVEEFHTYDGHMDKCAKLIAYKIHAPTTDRLPFKSALPTKADGTG